MRRAAAHLHLGCFRLQPLCVRIQEVKSTDYFLESVMVRRPYLKEGWLELALNKPLRVETQENGRICFWVFIDETNKYRRVVTEPDGETVHNAFFDRRFHP